MAWFGLGRVEFNSDGTIKKSGGGETKTPKNTNKKTTLKRSQKDNKHVEMFIDYITGIKFELSEVEKLLTTREKRSMIVALNRVIRKLES